MLISMMIWAHPRSRGENLAVNGNFDGNFGSSPLTRGKPHPRGNVVDRGRLIPAHAGKTSVPCRSRPGSRAHPRSRGENSPARTSSLSSWGSSPLTRGKHWSAHPDGEGQGLIPAHAGKTSSSWKWPKSWTAHPRSRGENGGGGMSTELESGSSPLTRGKPSLTCAFIKRIGQILESLELCASSGNYSLMDAYATDAPQDQARNTGLAPPSSRAAS